MCVRVFVPRVWQRKMHDRNLLLDLGPPFCSMGMLSRTGFDTVKVIEMSVQLLSRGLTRENMSMQFVMSSA